MKNKYMRELLKKWGLGHFVRGQVLGKKEGIVFLRGEGGGG